MSSPILPFSLVAVQKWVQAGSKHHVDGGAPFPHGGLAGLLNRLLGLEGGQVEEVYTETKVEPLVENSPSKSCTAFVLTKMFDNEFSVEKYHLSTSSNNKSLVSDLTELVEVVGSITLS